MSLVLDCEAEAADAHHAASHLRSCARCRLFACDVASFTRALRSRATGPSGRRQDDRADAAL